MDVAAGFGVHADTLRRWSKTLTGRGAGALAPAKTGPRGPSRLTAAVVADIRSRQRAGASLRVIAAGGGVSTDSVHRALPLLPMAGQPAAGDAPSKEATTNP